MSLNKRVFISIDYDKQQICYKFFDSNTWWDNDRFMTINNNYFIDKTESTIMITMSFNEFFNWVTHEKEILSSLVNFPDDFIEYIKLNCE